ncbi:MAG: uroporphyrinogen decarboxylase family protein [Spirochaetota bacterium]
MNSKTIFINTLMGKQSERIPCAPHWWGIYKYEVTGRDYKKDAWLDGTELSKVYIDFYQRFKPDWFHLHIGTPLYFRGSEIVEKEDKFFLRIAPEYRGLKQDDRYFSVHSMDDEEIVDFPDYILGSRAKRPRVDPGSRGKINEFVKKYVHMSAEEIIGLGYTDHIPPVVKRYGKEVFIAVHIPSAICEIFDPTTGYLGFEDGLLALEDYPGGMRYLFERCYEEQLEWAKAYAKAGVHAYIISESFISPDITGPGVYQNFLKDIHRDYFKEVENMGLIPICNFWGDVNQIIEDLKEINIRALMIEESKKSFKLDVAEIYPRLKGSICLFGNIDSITLLHDGTPEQIRQEVLRQASGVDGWFITANGSPITPGTPEENIEAMIYTAKEELVLPIR